MAEIELSAGTLEYGDSGGEGPVLVLLPGLAMDGRLWQGVIDELGPDFRCLTPTLPFGAHRQPMRADADLSLRGIGRLVAEFLERLDLRDVALCFNDWGGAQTMIADDLMGRVGKLVLVSCETDGNYPPGLGGHAAWLSCKLPGGLSMMRRTLLSPRLRRLPFVYGQMSKRGIPDELMRSWLQPLGAARDPARPAQVRRRRDAGQARHPRRDGGAGLFPAAGPRRLGQRGEDDAD